jgi:hypothetical protein
MATASNNIKAKVDEKQAENKGGEVVADHENVGDGYVDVKEAPKSAKAEAAEEASPEIKAAAKEIDRTRGLDAETLVGRTGQCTCPAGLTTKRYS